jgi:benzylsuccinate CoA-transferase BbsF subunit
MEDNMASRPFEGINILDFTWAATGPHSLNPLAFFGATIIKVESRGKFDGLRTLGPFKDGIADPEHSYSFAYSQSGKRYNVTLNLSHPKGMEIIKKLIKWADIVADSYSTGTMEKWGLDYEGVKKIKPDIIMLRTCMHGHTGPLSKQHGQGFVLTALTGVDSLISWPDRPPSGAYGPFTDYIAPQLNTLALIAALDCHRRTGKGQYIDQSQHEAVLGLLSPLILDYTVNKHDITGHGNRLAYAAPHGIYRCKGEERWCAIAVFSDEEWSNFCKVIGKPSLTKNPDYATPLKRKRNEDALDKLVEAWTIKHAPEDVMKLMQQAGVAAGLVSNAKDMAEDPQMKQYNFFEDHEHPVQKNIPFSHGPGFRMSNEYYEIGRSNLLGEHNDYVYTKLLGFSDEEWSQLISEGVV